MLNFIHYALLHNAVHTTCLASVGLHPFPSEDVPLCTTTGERVLKHAFPDGESPEGADIVRDLAECVAQEVLDRNPIELVNVVYEKSVSEGLIVDASHESAWRRAIFQWMTAVCRSMMETPVGLLSQSSLRPSPEEPHSAETPSIVNVTIPDVVVSPSTADPGVCERCHQARLRERCQSDQTPAYSSMAAKRAHRAWILQQLAQRPWPARPALLYLDDRLPLTEADPTQTTYLTDDLLAAFPERLRSYQLYSPNLKENVVRDLRQRGLIHTERCCACLFLQRCAAAIRDLHGGLILAFLDVWGGYAVGARPLLEISLSLRLLEPSGCLVTCASSDRGGRTRGLTAVQTYAAVQSDTQEMCQRLGYTMEQLRVSAPVAYNTMQTSTSSTKIKAVIVPSWRCLPADSCLECPDPSLTSGTFFLVLCQWK